MRIWTQHKVLQMEDMRNHIKCFFKKKKKKFPLKDNHMKCFRDKCNQEFHAHILKLGKRNRTLKDGLGFVLNMEKFSNNT